MADECADDLANQAELRLKLAQFAMDNVSIEIYWLDRNARICNANNHACKTLGYTREELRQLSLPDIDPNYPIALWLEHWQDLKRDKTQSFQTLHKCKNGEIFPVEVVANYVCFDGHEYYVGFARDISERKSVEDALHKEKEFFRLIAENVQDFIAVLDLEGRRIYNSPSYNRLFGNVEAMKGTNSFAEIYPDDRERVKHVFNESVQYGIGLRTEYRFLLPDGSIRHMESSSGLIKNSQGEPQSVIVVSHDVTERKMVEQEIKKLAFYDILTQLPNRRLLDDRLEQAIAACKRSSKYGAVMFLDLDNFKPLNDTHGHKAGDLLLVEVARRLVGCVREVDTVARFGGDEFVVVLNELDGDEPECAGQASNVAEKIRVSLSGPYWLTSNSKGSTKMLLHQNVGASIGVALFNMDASAENILKWADKAMYQAKDAGRNQICFYDSQR
jgi:diguanylate cyclase (GGDEF)-like protein/PAS domain S-box-containing protein